MTGIDNHRFAVVAVLGADAENLGAVLGQRAPANGLGDYVC